MSSDEFVGNSILQGTASAAVRACKAVFDPGLETAATR